MIGLSLRRLVPPVAAPAGLRVARRGPGHAIYGCMARGEPAGMEELPRNRGLAAQVAQPQATPERFAASQAKLAGPGGALAAAQAAIARLEDRLGR
jgi:hypothetical protein